MEAQIYRALIYTMKAAICLPLSFWIQSIQWAYRGLWSHIHNCPIQYKHVWFQLSGCNFHSLIHVPVLICYWLFNLNSQFPTPVWATHLSILIMTNMHICQYYIVKWRGKCYILLFSRAVAFLGFALPCGSQSVMIDLLLCSGWGNTPVVDMDMYHHPAPPFGHT